jgi:hypothetical protein
MPEKGEREERKKMLERGKRVEKVYQKSEEVKFSHSTTSYEFFYQLFHFLCLNPLKASCMLNFFHFYWLYLLNPLGYNKDL